MEILRIPTWNFNIECPYRYDDLFFLTTDINGTVKLSQTMADECAHIAKSQGHPSSTKPTQLLTGGTDAAEFERIGIPATTLMGMPWGNTKHAKVYHTPNDKVDAIEPKAVATAIQIVIEFIKQKDSK